MSNRQNGISIDRLKDLVRERSKRADLSLEDRRKIMDGNAVQFPVPDGVSVSAENMDGLSAEWSVPSGVAKEPVLLYFHGGGYLTGSSVSHRHITSRISLAAAARVLSVDYALAPENVFPAAVNDGVKAYRWLLQQGYAPSRIAVAGDSAGGGLAAAMLLAARDEGLPLPACAALISPWSDLTCDTESYKTKADADPMITPEGIRLLASVYLGGADPRNPLASPNFADLKGLPPMLIQVGTDEVLLDDARNLAAAAKEAGVDVRLEVWDGMIHVWHAFYQMLPEGEQAIDELGAYLREQWRVS